MKNFGKLWKGYNEDVDWMFPHFHSIKYTSVSFSVNKMLQVCVGMVDGFKNSDAVGKSIYRGSEDDMVLNSTLDVFSDITLGGWKF